MTTIHAASGRTHRCVPGLVLRVILEFKRYVSLCHRDATRGNFRVPTVGAVMAT
jgi:hypothetical protein